MDLKVSLIDRAFELASTQEGGVELSWYDKPAEVADDPLFVDGSGRVAGYLTILEDGRVCVPFTREGDYWVCVISQQGDVAIAKTEEYPPLDDSLVSVFS